MSTETLTHLFCAPSPVAQGHSPSGAWQAEGGLRAVSAPAKADVARVQTNADAKALLFIGPSTFLDRVSTFTLR
jgi:hypothetical protein